MGKTLCAQCGIRRAKTFRPPRCRQCVTGRSKTMGRPVGIKETTPRKRRTVAVVTTAGRSMPSYDLSAEQIEATYQAALAEIRRRAS